MRHNITGKKLGRNTPQRRALFAGQAVALITHEQISTTLAKAKVLRPIVEKMVTLAKRNTLHTRRQALAFLRDEAAVRKLFDTIGTRYNTRQGGYTRVLKAGFRKGDDAPMAIIEFVERDVDAKGKEDRARVKAEEEAALAAEEAA